MHRVIGFAHGLPGGAPDPPAKGKVNPAAMARSSPAPAPVSYDAAKLSAHERAINEALGIFVEEPASVRITRELPSFNVDEKTGKFECPSCHKKVSWLLAHLKKSENCSIDKASMQVVKSIEAERKKSRDKNRSVKNLNTSMMPQVIKEDPLVLLENGQCPACNQSFKRVLQHIGKSKCKTQVSLETISAFKDQREAKKKVDEGEFQRQKRFREATKFAAIFVCVSCHIKMFLGSVQEFTDNIKNKIKKHFPDLSVCIADQNITMKVNLQVMSNNNPKNADNEISQRTYICKNCFSYLKRGKLPPMSVKNNLELQYSDEELKKNGWNLEELEETLIGRAIMFEKIFFLPRSRWTALKGKIINVPISAESLQKTLNAIRLPRTPDEAQLIGVSLKRKLEYKNTHKKELIDINKMFSVLDQLVKYKSKHYTDVHTPEQYQQHCQETDKDGYNLLFDLDDAETGPESPLPGNNIKLIPGNGLSFNSYYF